MKLLIFSYICVHEYVFVNLQTCKIAILNVFLIVNHSQKLERQSNGIKYIHHYKVQSTVGFDRIKYPTRKRGGHGQDPRKEFKR
jgi:hypothetical protein